MSWRQRKLGELIEHFSVRAKDFGGSEGLEFLGVSNEVGITSSKYAAEDKAENYKIIEKGCFAYNPYRINVGSIGYLKKDIKGLISPAYVIFKAKENQIIPELLLKFLKSDEGLYQIRINARGTVRQALRFEDLVNIDISLPDIEEQKVFFDRILKIEEISKLISKELNHQLDLIKNLRQTFLKEAMQGKLVEQDTNDEPAKMLLIKIKAEKERLIKEKKIKKEKALPHISKEEIPFDIPKNWVWCRLGEIVSFLNGYAFKSSWYKDFGIPVLRNINMGVGEIIWKDVARIPESIADNYTEYLLETGDILLSLDRPIINAGLKVAQVKSEDLPCLLLQRVLKTSPIILSNNYIFIWFQSYLFVKSINPGRSIGIPHVSHNDVAQALIPLPPLSEQNRIVRRLEELMEQLNELETKILSSLNLNQLLIQQTLRQALGLKSSAVKEKNINTLTRKVEVSRLDTNTLLMELQELLKIHGKLQALELWQMSKFYGKADERNIDGFYAELKKLIEKEKIVREVEKGFLELV